MFNLFLVPSFSDFLKPLFLRGPGRKSIASTKSYNKYRPGPGKPGSRYCLRRVHQMQRGAL